MQILWEIYWCIFLIPKILTPTIPSSLFYLQTWRVSVQHFASADLWHQIPEYLSLSPVLITCCSCYYLYTYLSYRGYLPLNTTGLLFVKISLLRTFVVVDLINSLQLLLWYFLVSFDGMFSIQKFWIFDVVMCNVWAIDDDDGLIV